MLDTVERFNRGLEGARECSIEGVDEVEGSQDSHHGAELHRVAVLKSMDAPHADASLHRKVVLGELEGDAFSRHPTPNRREYRSVRGQITEPEISFSSMRWERVRLRHAVSLNYEIFYVNGMRTI